jgi:hypothetical protein
MTTSWHCRPGDRKIDLEGGGYCRARLMRSRRRSSAWRNTTLALQRFSSGCCLRCPRTRDFISMFIFDPDPVAKMTPQNLKAATAALVPLDQNSTGAFGPVLHRYGEVCLARSRRAANSRSSSSSSRTRSQGTSCATRDSRVNTTSSILGQPGVLWPRPPALEPWVEGQKIGGWTHIIKNMRNHNALMMRRARN